MSVHDVARRLRADPHFKSSLMIALTGWGQDEDRERSREAGFDRHLVKPVALDDLGRLLEEPRPVPAPAPRHHVDRASA
jgi:CheY-like chemotaxis protein